MKLAIIAAVAVSLPCLALALISVSSSAHYVAVPASSRTAAVSRLGQQWMGRTTSMIPSQVHHAEPNIVGVSEASLQAAGAPRIQVAAAWAVASGLFGAIAIALKTMSSKQTSVMMELTETKVHSSRVAMASTSGQKGTGREHAFALVVTNKGGGHGEIGLHLALALKAKGLEVQVINDNGGKDISSKPPFSEYVQLKAAGVEVTYTDLSKPGALQEATCPPNHLCRAYDYIFDNQNVCQKDVADLAASCGAFYTYVSSGGMYIPGDKFPMKECNATKGANANAQKKHEEYVLSSAVRPQLRGCAFFRPQYIVGPYTNKRDYLDWFFDRLTRNLPIPIPAPGTQTTTVTDARDVANMIASVVGKQEAIAEAEKANPALGPVFNCASDKPVSLFQLVLSCGAACGKSEAESSSLIRLYDPKLAKGAPSGGKFPFRLTSFDVGVDKAKMVLGWEAEYNDFDAVALGYYEGYKALGLDKHNPKLDTSFDEYILAQL